MSQKIGSPWWVEASEWITCEVGKICEGLKQGVRPRRVHRTVTRISKRKERTFARTHRPELSHRSRGRLALQLSRIRLLFFTSGLSGILPLHALRGAPLRDALSRSRVASLL